MPAATGQPTFVTNGKQEGAAPALDAAYRSDVLRRVKSLSAMVDKLRQQHAETEKAKMAAEARADALERYLVAIDRERSASASGMDSLKGHIADLRGALERTRYAGNWNEQLHPRGQPENAGEFSSSPGRGRRAALRKPTGHRSPSNDQTMQMILNLAPGRKLNSTELGQIRQALRPVLQSLQMSGHIGDFDLKPSHSAEGFVSGNVDDLNFEQAMELAGSEKTVATNAMFQDIDQHLGLPHHSESAIGDWGGGAEPSYMTTYEGYKDFESVKYAMAWKGLMADQKAVLIFDENHEGADRLWTFDLPDTIQGCRKSLDGAGIGERTITPLEEGRCRITLFDQGGAKEQHVRSIGEQYGLKPGSVSVRRGAGEFLGSWTSRSEGRAKFLELISQYETSRPDSRRYRPTGWRTEGLRAYVARERATAGATTEPEPVTAQPYWKLQSELIDYYAGAVIGGARGPWEASKHPRGQPGNAGQFAEVPGHPSPHVKVKGNGQIRLKHPVTPEHATKMLEALESLHDIAQKRLDTAGKLPENHDGKVMAELVADHTRRQLQRGLKMARKILGDHVAEAESRKKQQPEEKPVEGPGMDMAQIAKAYPAAHPESRDTYTRYRTANGTWTPERSKLHDQIVDKMMHGAKPTNHPSLTFLGGGPATGKTRVIGSALGEITGSALINADDAKASIPEYVAMSRAGDKDAARLTHEESSYVSKLALSRSFAHKTNAVLDSTGNGQLADIKKKCDAARAAGFKVNAEYATCDTDTAVQRAMERGKKTGRFVPESILRETHRNVSQIVPHAVAAGLFDHFRLWDTNEHGKPPTLVAHATGNQLHVLDAKRWQSFLDKGK